MCGIDTLTMEQVKAKLHLETSEAAARWCISHGIMLRKEGKLNVVDRYDFEIVFQKPLIDMLKKRYGNKWQKYYQAYNSEDVSNFYAIQDEPEDVCININYNPKTFLKEIGYEHS